MSLLKVILIWNILVIFDYEYNLRAKLLLFNLVVDSKTE